MALAGSILSRLKETLILAITYLISSFKVDIALNLHFGIWIVIFFRCDCLLRLLHILTGVDSIVSSFEDFLRTELKGKQKYSIILC